MCANWHRKVGVGRRDWPALLVLLATLFGAGVAGAAERLSVSAGTSPVLGAADAPLTVVEFVDYQ